MNGTLTNMITPAKAEFMTLQASQEPALKFKTLKKSDVRVKRAGVDRKAILEEIQ